MNHLSAKPLGSVHAAVEVLPVQRSSPQECHFMVKGGMDCPHCAEGLQKMAAAVPGVATARVHFSAARLEISLEPTAELSPARTAVTIADAVTKRAGAMGFQLALVNGPQAEGVAEAPGIGVPSPRPMRLPHAAWLNHPAFLSAVFLAAGIFAEHVLQVNEIIVSLLLGTSVALGLYRVARSGLAALRERIISINLLVTTAVIGAICLGQWEEAATVVALYLLGVTLETAAAERARQSLHALVESCPDEAVIQRPDLTHAVVRSDTLCIGDVLVVKPGAHIAADGRVLSGTSEVNQSSLTGESLPAEKHPGHSVYAGSLNGSGALLVQVEASASDSTLARVMRLAEEAHTHKSKNQDLLEKFGRIYTPAVLLVAVLTALLGPILAPGQDWLHRALTLLVVACPCALVVATPMTHVCAVARASRLGILVKGGRHLETLAQTRTVFFDKTGTLTNGHFRVTDVTSLHHSFETKDVLRYAAAAEQCSEHPIAQAITMAASASNASVLPLDVVTTEATTGHGVSARLADGRSILVGTAHFLREAQVAVVDALLLQEQALIRDGKTVSFVALGGVAIGVIGVNDTVRPEASAAIPALRRSGYKIALLTGDNEGTATRIAQALGITDVRARLLPEQKLHYVEAREKMHKVVFVGDGLNDAPSLAAASVGIALRGAGVAASLEAADVVLMSDNLAPLPRLFALARATRAAVRWNLIFSVAVMGTLLAGSLIGSLNLSAGILAHEGGTLLVLLNGLRLLSPRLTPLSGTSKNKPAPQSETRSTYSLRATESL